MELRYLVLCDKNGKEEEAPVLQYKDEDGDWLNVEVVKERNWGHDEQE